MPTRDWRRFALPIRRSLGDAVDFLYPPACALCGRSRHAADSVPRLLCDECQSDVAPLYPHRCHRCSAPVGPYVNTSAGCYHCSRDSFAFKRIVSLGIHHGPLRNAVLTVKQQKGAILANALAELLITREQAFFDVTGADVVVPVPHHWTDRLLSQHLPPETLAACIAGLLKVPMGRHILKKVRRTPAQVELEASERRRNLRDAFRLIGRPQLDGVRILLVDDVLTTGTTAHRAASLLKKAGATVNVAVLARGLGAATQPFSDVPTGPF
ncbi:MAG: ComF family protein [Planctomycetaceae bacterium]|nr:ComF family protein [Planctomycetaceae bacterium]